MIKIKYKIAIPFMIIILVIPLVTMLLFNIFMQSYVMRTSREDLNNAIETTNYLIKQEAGASFFLRQDNEKIADLLPKIKAALKTSKISSKTEIVLLNRQGRLIYPRTYTENSFLNDELINSISDIDFDNKNSTLQIEVADKEYLLAQHSTKQSIFKFIYILSMDNANGLIRTINILLVTILAIATLVGLFMSLLISNGISKPIKTINNIANKIGHGDFVTMEPINTSMEIYELCNSMNSMSKSLDQLNRNQRTFLQNASHELRTPLMSVQGYAEGIIKGVFTDNAQAAKVICDESKRLTSLVEQLIVLSKIENNTFKINMCRIDLKNIMKDFIQRINGFAIKSEKELVYTEDEEQIPVIVDEELLSQAVVNVATNSLRYAQTKVTIHIFKDKSNAYIKISDDGCGISDEDIAHIFERFYKGKGGNFGLGLSIAKSSIQALKGTIMAYNTTEGAEFLIKLPNA